MTAMPRPEVRQAVKALLTQSPAFAKLSAERQQQVARDTALIADYLAAPEGIPAQQLGMPRALEGDTGPQEESYSEASKQVGEIGKGKFKGEAAREGAKVAGLLMKQVNFPTFVSSLIDRKSVV